MRKILTVFLLCAVLCVVFGCSVGAQDTNPESTAPTDVTTPANSTPTGYQLQKEDVMKVSVWNEPNFSAEVMIDPAGYISLPYLDPVYVEGMTQAQLTEVIAKGLTKYLVNPKVRIEIIMFRKPKVYVFGQVNRPNVYEFLRGATVVEAVSMAGSFTEAANLEEATITRKGEKEKISVDLNAVFYKGDMSQNLEIKDGDTIFIPEMQMYSVVGEVFRQGQFRLKKGTTVMDAISNAGGAKERAKLNSTYVLRGDMSKPERIKVDIAKFMKETDVSQNIELKPGDVVYVAETSKPDWDRFSRVLGSIVNATYLFHLWGL